MSQTQSPLRIKRGVLVARVDAAIDRWANTALLNAVRREYGTERRKLDAKLRRDPEAVRNAFTFLSQVAEVVDPSLERSALLICRLLEIMDELEKDVETWRQDTRRRKKPARLRPLGNLVKVRVKLDETTHNASWYMARRIAKVWLAYENGRSQAYAAANYPAGFQHLKRILVTLWGASKDQKVREQRLAAKIRTAYYNAL